MAFADKYKITIEDWEGATVTATIQEDNFSGTLEEFTPTGGRPIVIEHQANTNVKESYIIPSQARISFYVTDQWDCHDLLYATDRQYKVIIKRGTVEQFVGWVVAGIQSEDYDTGRYMIKVLVTDGLNDLKNIPYLNSGALFDDYRTLSIVISDCLLSTGLTLDYWENTDIYAASGMTTSPINIWSPLTQAAIHTKAYGDEVDSVLSCWTVLENILQAFYCRLYQSESIDGTNSVRWVMSKINKIGSSELYRRITSAGVSTASSYTLSPLVSIGATYQHVGGKASISVQQAYKEINLKATRGDIRLLDGFNFIDSDFPTTTTLTNWGSPSILTNLVSGWTVAAFDQETIANNTVVAMDDFTGAGQLGLHNVSDNGAGKVRISGAIGTVTTNDWVVIPKGTYRGMWKVQAVSGTSYYDIIATYDANGDTQVYWSIYTSAKLIEYDRAIALDSDQIAVDNEDQSIQLEVDYNLRYRGGTGNAYTIVVMLVAYVNASNYKVLNNEGEWVDNSVGEIHPIIIGLDADGIGDQSIDIKGLLSSTNNFYTTGSPKFYLGLFSMGRGTGTVKTIRYNSVNLKVIPSIEKEVTALVNDDYVDSLDVDFFHADAAGDDNDEFIYINPIFDDSSSRLAINSWQQDGATADNIEDIVQANLEAAYGANSQIWAGSIKGDLKPYNAIKIPLNLDRVYQVQRISRDMVNRFNSVSLIEIEPKEAYYIERVTSQLGDKYFLSNSYNDISGLFLDGQTIEISDIRDKSSGALIESGNVVRTIDGDATYAGFAGLSGSRTTISISDAAWIIDPSILTEVKGVLRIV